MPTSKTKVKKESGTVLPVTTLGGQKIGQIDLGWCAQDTASPLLVAQVIHTDEQHSRIRRAHTKDRGEVRGGGRKPWRQKGTGRSRHGSSRSPLWVGGGTTFGPRSRHEYLLRLPLKMRQRALRATFSEALREERLAVVRLDRDLPTKTKDVAKLLPIDARKVLLIAANNHAAQLERVAGNIKSVTIVSVSQVTVRQLVDAGQLWVDEEALATLRARGAWPTN